jgi:hypothetical protein
LRRLGLFNTQNYLFGHPIADFKSPRDCLPFADRLLHPPFLFGLIAMTFEQANSGHRHCDEQNLSENENFGGSNLPNMNTRRAKGMDYSLYAFLNGLLVKNTNK